MTGGSQKITEAIQFFEAMLESMPGDKTSLEFLVVAYEQVGECAKRRRCLIELADTLVAEQDFANAQTIASQLLVYGDDRETMAAIQRVNEAVASQENPRLSNEAGRGDPDEDGSFIVPEPGIEVHAFSRAALSAEMDLVWTLKDKAALPSEICEKLISALSEFPVNDRPQLISALSLLDDLHPEWTDKVLCELLKLSRVPLIPLELFDCKALRCSGVSPAYITVRGVVPFAKMADDYLVAVLNPLDKKLRREIRARLDADCHFFLCHPRTGQEVLFSLFDAAPSAESGR